MRKKRFSCLLLTKRRYGNEFLVYGWCYYCGGSHSEHFIMKRNAGFGGDDVKGIIPFLKKHNFEPDICDVAFICAVSVLYLLNNLVIKSCTTGAVHMFFVCYFNDLMAPFFILPYTNILLSARNTRMRKLGHILLFMLTAGLVWEYFAPFIKKGAVTDMMDMACYIMGGCLYWAIGRWRRT